MDIFLDVLGKTSVIDSRRNRAQKIPALKISKFDKAAVLYLGEGGLLERGPVRPVPRAWARSMVKLSTGIPQTTGSHFLSSSQSARRCGFRHEQTGLSELMSLDGDLNLDLISKSKTRKVSAEAEGRFR